MRATWQGEVIAESDRTIEVDGYQYFPREAVKMALLSAAPKTASDLECPHGVQFYDVSRGGTRFERGAWSYERPHGGMSKIDHWMGFWGEVKVGP